MKCVQFIVTHYQYLLKSKIKITDICVQFIKFLQDMELYRQQVIQLILF